MCERERVTYELEMEREREYRVWRGSRGGTNIMKKNPMYIKAKGGGGVL